MSKSALAGENADCLDLDAKTAAFGVMKSRVMIIAACVSLLVLGSAMALAQSAPPGEAVEAEPSPQAPAPEPQASTAQPPSPPEPAAELATAPVEDAPVDVPSPQQSNWAPDINLDAQNQADAVSSTPQRKAKPRKILSDAGENPLGTNSWSQSTNSEEAQAALLARSNRRERAIDPIKRSNLTRLARVMGALHALRVSCSGRDDQTYRSRMATMLDLEAPDSGGLRDPLVDAFNGGFQVYGRGANTCPTDARVQEASLAKDGYTIARTMSAQYRPAPKAVAALPPATQPRKNPVVAEKAGGLDVRTAPQASRTQPSRTQPSRAQPSPARPSWNKATPN